MLISAIKAILGITIIIGGWLSIQMAWRRVFPGIPADADVLTGRIGCQDCPQDSCPERSSCQASDDDPFPKPSNEFEPNERTSA